MVQVLAVRVAQETQDEAHITYVRWYNTTTGEIGVATTAAMIEYFAKGSTAYACDGIVIKQVVVRTLAGAQFIGIEPQGGALANLTRLPRF